MGGLQLYSTLPIKHQNITTKIIYQYVKLTFIVLQS